MNSNWKKFALVAVLALATGACGGQTATGSVSTYIGEPRSILTTNATESEGAAVLSALYTTLVGLDTDGNPEMRAAESVESDDQGKTWVVTIREGWTFHDGTPVTAESYVRSWNYAAYGLNAQQGAGFFAGIEGYADLQCGTRPATQEDVDAEVAEAAGDDVTDCEGSPPVSDTLSGLVVDSDTQFTVSLETPEAFFPIRLVYDPYNPYPESFYDDPDGFAEMPIGNGPFMMVAPWEHDVSIELTAYPDYAGDNPAQIENLTFMIFDDIDTAMNELLAGNLDIHDGITPERASEFDSGQVPGFGTAENSTINFLGMPFYDPDLGGNENRDLRVALSMAIDRQAITEAIFDGRRQPAYNLLSPVIPGYEEQVCDAWSFDPVAAKELYDTTGGLPANFSFWFNSGGGHENWIEAVTNQWAANLGIDVTSIEFESLDFADYLQRLEERDVTGPFRLGWGMDYPHPQNYLQLLLDSRFFGDAGGSNLGFYSNPDYDAKIDQALGIFDVNESLPVWQEVAEIACEDVALIPMFYGQTDYAWNDSVSNVSVDQFGNVRWTDLEATS